MRCASHGADRIRPSAIRPTEAEAFPGEDDRSNDRDGLVTEGEPQAGGSHRVVPGSGGGREEEKGHPRGGERSVTVAGGVPEHPLRPANRRAPRARTHPWPLPPPAP